jgi:hypothetical protein
MRTWSAAPASASGRRGGEFLQWASCISLEAARRTPTGPVSKGNWRTQAYMRPSEGPNDWLGPRPGGGRFRGACSNHHYASDGTSITWLAPLCRGYRRDVGLATGVLRIAATGAACLMADRPALTQVASTQAASAFEARKSTTAVVMAAGLTLALVGLELAQRRSCSRL